MDRIYIDATDTANTLHHTGIQRVVRSLVLFGAVRGEEWIPVVWGGSSFRAPTRSERSRLFEVFSKGLHRRKGLSRFLDRWEKKWEVDFLGESDRSLLLIPEIPNGERLAYLDDLAATGRRQIKMAAVCHDLLSWSSPQWTAPSRSVGFVEYLKFLGLVERVICPSRFTADEWHRFQSEAGIVGAGPEVMPWPIYGEPWQEQSVTTPPMILCVGTLEARKNHARLLDAAEILWAEGLSFRLEIVGRKRAKNENEISDRVRSLQENGLAIAWRGQGSDQELEQLYSESLFTAFPSLAEGYGLPVAESLIRGKPCVCAGSGAVGEVAAGGGCLTVDVSSSEDLAAGIRSLLNNEELLADLQKQAAERTWPTWTSWMDRIAGKAEAS